MNIEGFEWDDSKASRNLAKHGVSFFQATEVYDDQNAIFELDNGEALEERWQVIGLTSGGMLFVVHSEPDADTIRIISARKASPHEQDRYFRQALSQE